jgi:dTDP-4-dehydrorhamnose reductase
VGLLKACGRGEFPIGPDSLSEFLDNLKPSVIINSAAFTAVDLCESQPIEATLVNVTLPGILASWAARNDCLLIHYSTDYVFDGAKDAPYLETDTPNPLNFYGRSKLEGERLISELAPKHLIFRTSWVYSLLGKNFPKTILKMAQSQDRLTVNDEQIGAPTPAAFIAAVTLVAIKIYLTSSDAPTGLYHLTPTGSVTWHDFARQIISQARLLGWPLSPELPILFPSYGPDPTRPAVRPINSRLDTSKLTADFGVYPPDWSYFFERFMLTLKTLSLPS